MKKLYEKPLVQLRLMPNLMNRFCLFFCIFLRLNRKMLPVCTARAWLLMAGFSLAFGAMFSKTWRVHSIFTDVKLNKKVIKDYQLFMVVGILLAIDIVIMLTWQFADPFYRDTKQIEPAVSCGSLICLFVEKTTTIYWPVNVQTDFSTIHRWKMFSLFKRMNIASQIK